MAAEPKPGKKLRSEYKIGTSGGGFNLKPVDKPGEEHTAAWLMSHPNKLSSPKEIAGHHGHHPHGPSIRWPALYEHLRLKGHDKASAAMISNSAWAKKHSGRKTNSTTSVKGLVKMDTDIIEKAYSVKTRHSSPVVSVHDAAGKLVGHTGVNGKGKGHFARHMKGQMLGPYGTRKQAHKALIKFHEKGVISKADIPNLTKPVINSPMPTRGSSNGVLGVNSGNVKKPLHCPNCGKEIASFDMTGQVSKSDNEVCICKGGMVAGIHGGSPGLRNPYQNPMRSPTFQEARNWNRSEAAKKGWLSRRRTSKPMKFTPEQERNIAITARRKVQGRGSTAFVDNSSPQRFLQGMKSGKTKGAAANSLTMTPGMPWNRKRVLKMAVSKDSGSDVGMSAPHIPSALKNISVAYCPECKKKMTKGECSTKGCSMSEVKKTAKHVTGASAVHDGSTGEALHAKLSNLNANAKKAGFKGVQTSTTNGDSGEVSGMIGKSDTSGTNRAIRGVVRRGDAMSVKPGLNRLRKPKRSEKVEQAMKSIKRIHKDDLVAVAEGLIEMKKNTFGEEA